MWLWYAGYSTICVSTLAAHLCFLLRVWVVWCTFLSATCWFSHISSWWILACVRVGREGSRSGLWGMLGDFNNAEAVQWDLIKEDDVITDPWLWATFPHSNIRSLSLAFSLSLSHAHTHTHSINPCNYMSMYDLHTASQHIQRCTRDSEINCVSMTESFWLCKIMCSCMDSAPTWWFYCRFIENFIE